MTCCHRSKILPAYSVSMTYVNIQCCLPLLIWMKTLQILSACSKTSHYAYEFDVYRQQHIDPFVWSLSTIQLHPQV
jgi:hypothetical protein